MRQGNLPHLLMEKKYRLTDNSQFQAVRQKGRSWAHPLLILGAAPNGLTITRCGFTTAKQINSAVARNRARRLLREALRQLHPTIQTGWDLVFVARQPAAEGKCQAVSAAMEGLLRRARLFQGTTAAAPLAGGNGRQTAPAPAQEALGNR